VKSGKVPHVGKSISRLVLGSVPLSTSDQEAGYALLDAYLAEGGNTIDLAHVYGGGDQQRVVGQWMRDRDNRDKVVLFDKGCHPYGSPRVTREDMASDIRENHERLGVEKTEFFVLHRDDPTVPAGDIVEWLNEHVAAGRIEAFGGSNWHHRRIEEANEYAEKRDLQGFSVSSPNLSLATVNEPMWEGCYTVDREAREWYERTQFPLFAWSSAGGGFFSEVDSADVHRVYDNDENGRRLARAREVGERYGASPQQIALAWTLCQPLNVWALIGPTGIGQLKESVAAANLELKDEELRYLELGEQ
jgi:1-deoxyxylulose-5-phosphate synthase